MPPKRKAGGAAKAKAGGKKAKAAETAEPTTSDKVAQLRALDAKTKKLHKPDKSFPFSATHSVVDDYDCMLNQTNIGQNNNKYYIIQLLVDNGGDYCTWNRWGRVGEPGQISQKHFWKDFDAAKKDFVKKFSDKTKNKWANKDDFVPVSGKYTLIEMACDDEDDTDDTTAAVASSAKSSGQKVATCTLPGSTQKLMKLIFDHDMFKSAMENFKIDVKKMPLGKISKSQIAKGFECLEELDAAINAKKSKKILNELSSRFYTLIPHSFGRTIPPTIDDVETVHQKNDMLGVLGDIEVALSMQKESEKAADMSLDEIPHPHDVNYKSLHCGLELLDKKSKEYKTLETYLMNTKSYNLTINDIWKVNRDGENDRFKQHNSIKERKLLWHGTNVAVVAAILKTGLRIMPHSGGRLGAGIYFASENAKSSGYVSPAQKTGLMFLNEVALGKEKTTYQNMSSVKSAPKGYDSIVGRGTQEPDPSKDATMTLDGNKVIVPQGKAITQSKHSESRFYQSEYLIYKESQCQIRYMFSLKWPY